MSNFERKFGKYAINNLPLMMIMCYGVGYIIKFINPSFLNYLTLNPYAILHGQIWRVITWLIIPPTESNIFFILIMLLFYYSIGSSLERTWGTYQYNIYIFSGILFTLLGAFLLMGYAYLVWGNGILGGIKNSASLYSSLMFTQAPADYFAYAAMAFTTYYVNMSIFLGYAATFPEARVLLFFIIPIKVKWMGIVYAGLMVYEFFLGTIEMKFAIFFSLLNFAVFWLRTRNGGFRVSPKQMKRKMEFNRNYNAAAAAGRSGKTVTRHKCAICGRTELDSPDMQFRFCSKCEGNYEYCEEHLYTHTHIKMS